jgi:hypothetical protein
MKISITLITILIAALFSPAPTVCAQYYLKKPAPTIKTVSTNTVFSSTQYTDWSRAKSQILQTSPYFSYDAKWKANLPKLNTSLERIDSILIKVKNSSDAYMIANKSYFKNLAAELLALEKTIDSLEEQLATVGDDAQLANIDLQNMLLRQQQTMQLISKVSKMIHDTAMAIIRKIG